MKRFAKILITVVFSFFLLANYAAADVGGALTQTQRNPLPSALTQTQSNPLVGTWLNELGSKLTIESVENGNVKGFFETAVSSKGCAKGKFPLLGRANIPSIGFVVSWTNSESICSSVTAWSGQLQNDKIVTTWLLTSQTVSSNNWQSTIVNKDTFTRGS